MSQSFQSLSETRLQEELISRADQMRKQVARKIPVNLQSIVSSDDVLQEVWIAAFGSLRSFRADRPDALARWLSTLLERRVIDACRAARAQKRGGGEEVRNRPATVGSFVDLFDRLASPHRTPSRELSAKEATDAVRIALGSLPENRRQAVWMRHIEGHSMAEVAAAMETTPGAVNSLVYNGLQQLRQQLDRAARFFSDAADDRPEGAAVRPA